MKTTFFYKDARTGIIKPYNHQIKCLFNKLFSFYRFESIAKECEFREHSCFRLAYIENNYRKLFLCSSTRRVQSSKKKN